MMEAVMSLSFQLHLIANRTAKGASEVLLARFKARLDSFYRKGKEDRGEAVIQFRLLLWCEAGTEAFVVHHDALFLVFKPLQQTFRPLGRINSLLDICSCQTKAESCFGIRDDGEFSHSYLFGLVAWIAIPAKAGIQERPGFRVELGMMLKRIGRFLTLPYFPAGYLRVHSYPSKTSHSVI